MCHHWSSIDRIQASKRAPHSLHFPFKTYCSKWFWQSEGMERTKRDYVAEPRHSVFCDTNVGYENRIKASSSRRRSSRTSARILLTSSLTHLRTSARLCADQELISFTSGSSWVTREH